VSAVKRRYWRLVSNVKYWTYCRFWGCQPPDDGTWWHTRTGIVVLTPETSRVCGHCLKKLPL
jgi:hypothetical protein